MNSSSADMEYSKNNRRIMSATLIVQYKQHVYLHEITLLEFDLNMITMDQ